MALAGLCAAAPSAGAAQGDRSIAPGGGAASAHAAPLVLDQVTVIDVEHGQRLADQRVVVVNNRIQALGSLNDVALPPGARVVNAEGKYLIPGLWDLHFHATVWAPSPEATIHQVSALYRQLVVAGITGIRDPGSQIPLATLRLWRQEIAAGQRVGPRLIVTGPSIEGRTEECTRTVHPRPPCEDVHVYIDSPDQAPHLVDSIKAAGADMIKIHSVPPQIWFAIAAAARRAGISFGGHFNRSDDLPGVDGLVASDSGARILDHSLYANVCRSTDTLPTQQSDEQCAAAAARLRRNRTWVVGGFGGVWLSDSMRSRALSYGNAGGAVMSTFDGVQVISDGESWRPLTAVERDRLPTGAQLAATVTDSARQAAGCRWARRAHAVDLPLLPGLDFPIGPVLGTPLALLMPALCGVPPAWLLRAATLAPAEALGLTDSLGTVEQGKVADLVLLQGDPLADIWNVTKIEAVIADGRYLDRPALDQLLIEAREEWRQGGVLVERSADDGGQSPIEPPRQEGGP